jgi:hypothetical protein
LIANLFLHYGFDTWMTREFPGVRFERLADDAVVHCVTERQAYQVRQAIGRRFADIGLLLRPDKTRIVYCKDDRRRRDYDQVTFTFCGYAFRPRKAWDKIRGRARTGFLPAAAPGKLTDMSRKVASWRLHRRTTSSLDDLAGEVNPALRGWLNYFTVFYPSAVIPMVKRVDRHLMRWAKWKYKRLKRSDERARAWLQGVRQRTPGLFAHWVVDTAVHDLTTERHEPDKPRGLRPDLWGTAGEIPAVYPAMSISISCTRRNMSWRRCRRFRIAVAKDRPTATVAIKMPRFLTTHPTAASLSLLVAALNVTSWPIAPMDASA